jgi:hypothetical protein
MEINKNTPKCSLNRTGSASASVNPEPNAVTTAETANHTVVNEKALANSMMENTTASNSQNHGDSTN